MTHDADGTAAWKVNGTVTILVSPLQEAWAQLAAHQMPGPGQMIAAAGPDTTPAVFGWGVLHCA